MNKTVKWILIALVAVIVILVSVKLIAGNGNDEVKVAIEKAAKRTIIETVNASGQIYPEIEVKITPDISGEITELNVQEGDSVKKGQVLARIYADIYATQRDQAASAVTQQQAIEANSTAQLDALKATLDQAKRTYDRQKQLVQDKVISAAEFEQAESSWKSAKANYDAAVESIKANQASIKSAQANLQRADKDLSRTTLTSPMNGVISSLSVKKGERVAGNSFNVGTEMMRVADMSVMEVRVNVGENDIVKVNLGDSADIEVDAYNNRKFSGVVTQIAASTKTSATASSTNDVTNYEVRIRINPNSYKDLIDPAKPRKWPFRPGMNASADIKTRKLDNVLSVPINAVAARVKGSDKSVADKKKEDSKNKPTDDNKQDNGAADAALSNDLEEVVFVKQKDNTVKKTIVKTGIQDINYIQITSGLNEGDEVVTAPYNAVSKTLKDGNKITVVAKDKLFKN